MLNELCIVHYHCRLSLPFSIALRTRILRLDDVTMEPNGISFLDKVLNLVKEDRAESVPLIRFKHPKELEVGFIWFFEFNEGIQIM